MAGKETKTEIGSESGVVAMTMWPLEMFCGRNVEEVCNFELKKPLDAV